MFGINVLLFTDEMLCDSFIRQFETSSILNKLYVIGKCKSCSINNRIQFVKFDTIKDFETLIKEKNINLVINSYTVFARMGLVDFIKYNLGIPVVGVTKYWAELECSKLYAKKFMTKYNLPCPIYSVIKNFDDLKNCINEYGLPLVLKDDTLQSGFGSYICKTEKACKEKAKKLLNNNTFFTAEKYIKGEEVTLQMMWNGNCLIPFLPVRDYKRFKENNEGINTGSMGSYVPAKLSSVQKILMDNFVKKLEEVFINIKPDFRGIFAADLIFSGNNVYNLEFNMRPCSPEFEVITEHLDGDFLDILYHTAISDNKNKNLSYKSGITGCVNIVHKDYERHISPKKTKKIKISPDFLAENETIKINTCITDINDKNEALIYPYFKLITLIKNDYENPFPDIYKYLHNLNNKSLYYRSDIGSEI